MPFDTRVTWEKLLLEIRNLQPEDGHSIIPLMIGANALIWPKDGVESCFRQIHFHEFELQKVTEKSNESERWDRLREYFFTSCGFQILNTKWTDWREEDLLLQPILENRIGHPLPMTLLYLHLALAIRLPVSLVQARQHFILKWTRPCQTCYLDVLRNGRALDDCETFQVLQGSGANLEAWDAKLIFRRYLEELMRLYERISDPQMLHSIYNICLHLDDSNMPILGRRALLRQRMGFAKEALTDLKRYFSFVDRGHAPIELQKAMMDLESTTDDSSRDSFSRLLH